MRPTRKEFLKGDPKEWAISEQFLKTLCDLYRSNRITLEEGKNLASILPDYLELRQCHLMERQ